MTNQGGNFVIGFIMPTLLASTGFWSFTIFVACCVLCAVFSLWLPETAGESLESITALFEAKLGKRSVSGARQAAVVPAMPTSGTQWRELVERDGKV